MYGEQARIHHDVDMADCYGFTKVISSVFHRMEYALAGFVGVVAVQRSISPSLELLLTG